VTAERISVNVDSFDPVDTGYNDFVKSIIQQISQNMGVPYDKLSAYHKDAKYQISES